MFRKISSASGVLALLLLLCACASAAAPTEKTVTEADAGKTIELKQGDILVVLLEGNPTTGYNWELSPDAPVTVLQQVGDVTVTQASSAVGSGGIVSLRFKAVEAGEQKLALIYHRSFEQGVPPQKTFDVNVKVISG